MRELAIAIVSVIVGAILGPYINWGIEKKRQKLSYRRDLVAKWRAMLQEVAQEKADNNTTRLRLESHRDFYSFLPHLNERSTPIDNALLDKFSPELSPLITHLVNEVERIEREWDLT
jgi:hypothetical protein